MLTPDKLSTTKSMGTKLLNKIRKRTLTPRVASQPTRSYTLLRKEEEEGAWLLSLYYDVIKYGRCSTIGATHAILNNT